MAPHSSTLAWKIPWMEEPGELQSMGSQRVGHDLVTKQQEHSSNMIGTSGKHQLQGNLIEEKLIKNMNFLLL